MNLHENCDSMTIKDATCACMKCSVVAQPPLGLPFMDVTLVWHLLVCFNCISQFLSASNTSVGTESSVPEKYSRLPIPLSELT